MASVKYPELQDTTWLRREYVRRKRSAKAIAEQVGCSPATVSVTLTRRGIFRLPPPPRQPVVAMDLSRGSRQVATPRARCRCDRPLVGDDELCVKCGR